MNVLIIDVGGSEVKLWLSENGEGRTFVSGDQLTPERMAAQTLELVGDWQFEVVALGLPTRVIAGRPVQEPTNLGDGWIPYNFEKGLGKPVRVINDAELQALGSYRGGRMLFLGLGTGVGSCLIAHNTLISVDAGALMHANGRPIWYLLNRAARKRMGTKKWMKLVIAIAVELKTAMFVNEVVIGGGQADRLTGLPEGVRQGDNRAVVEGGIRLWRDLPDLDHQPEHWRIV